MTHQLRRRESALRLLPPLCEVHPALEVDGQHLARPQCLRVADCLVGRERKCGVAQYVVLDAAETQLLVPALGLAVFTTVSLSAADARLHDGFPRRLGDVAGGGRHRDRRRQHQAHPGRSGAGTIA